MKKKSRGQPTRSPKKGLKNLAPTGPEQVKAGRMEAQVHSRSVNPIVISRDRALNG
jgi:hypothetical protein